MADDINNPKRKTYRLRNRKIWPDFSCITPDMCFTALCAFGPGTSMESLRQTLDELYGCAPAHSTLKKWKKEYDWTRRLELHYRDQQRQVLELLEQRAPERLANTIEYLEDIKVTVLETARDMVVGGKGTTPGLRITGHVSELKTLLHAAIECSSHVQLLSGKPTSINENREILQDLDDATLARRFKRFIEHEQPDPASVRAGQDEDEKGSSPKLIH